MHTTKLTEHNKKIEFDDDTKAFKRDVKKITCTCEEEKDYSISLSSEFPSIKKFNKNKFL
mgnify:CR=1 FL=1